MPSKLNNLDDRLAKLSPTDRKRFIERVQQQLRPAAMPPTGKAAAAPEIARASRDKPLPLSLAQQRLWLLEQLRGADVASPYHELGGVEIHGHLDVEVLRRSLTEVVRRHEVLRTTFLVRDGLPYQQINDPHPVELPLVDMQDIAPDVQMDRLQELARQQVGQPFELARGPLLRCLLVRRDQERHVLMITVHHIVYDQSSENVFGRELAGCYEALVKGRPAELPELAVQYADYAAWERGQLAGDRIKGQISYWRDQLAGVPALLQLPTDRPRPATPSFRGAAIHFELGAAASAAVGALNKLASTTDYMTLLAVFVALLQRYTGQQDIVVGTTLANRTRPELEGMIGLFVNLLPIRADVSGNPTFRELLGRVRNTALAAFDNQDVSFDMLVESLKIERRQSYAPIFQVLFVFFNSPPTAIRLEGLHFSPLDLHPGTAKYDLTLTMVRTDRGIRAILDYNTDLFETATMVGLSQRFRALVESVARAPATTLDDLPLDLPVAREVAAPKQLASALAVDDHPARLPLSYHGERLWFIDRFETGNVYESNPTYHNMPYLMHLRGHVDCQALAWSLSQLVQRHSALRTRFVGDGGEPRQVVLPEANLQLEVLREPANLDEAIERALEYAAQPFNLEVDLLVRAAMVPLALDESLLVLAVHHIVADRESLKILGHELAETYAGRETRGVAPLAPPDAQYADYARWQRSLGYDAWEPLLFHWRWRLRGKLQVLDLPEDRPRPAVHTYTAASYKFALDAWLAQRIEAEHEALPVLLTGFSILLHRYTRHDDIVVGTSMRCRGPQQSNLVGPVDNLTVLRSFLGGNPTCRSVLSQMQQTVRSAHLYRHLPFDLLVQKLNPEKDMSRTALFDVLFQYEPTPPRELPMGTVRARVLETNLGLGKYDLNLLLQRTETGMSGTLVYNSDIYDASTVERMMGHYRRLLESITRDWQVRVNDLELLGDDELHEQLVTWNSTAASYPSSKTIHERFEDQVRQYFNRTALVCGEVRLTYGELNGRANRLAHALRQQGVAPDTLVALCLDRSPEMVVALLAVLKAGGAYLPIEPSLPASRIQFIVADAGVTHLVTTGELAARLPAGLPAPILLGEATLLDGLPKTNPDAWASPGNLAYSIYTSGSTGQPKGVLIEHRNVVRLLVNDKLPFTFTCDDVWTMFHSYSFDFSVWEMYGALLYGGKLVMVPREATHDPARYLDLLEHEGVTVLNQTPSAFYLLAQEACAGRPRELALRYVIFGGEALQPAQLKRWFEAYPRTRLVNMYGITETTVHVTFKEIARADIEQNSRSVGGPIPTTTLYVMDSALGLLPVGVPGEICVGGLGVGRGYLNRDEMTRTKFVNHPYRPEERLYRSGDLGRLLPNGELAYLGRIDDQVQIRGFRVELGEVDAALSTHPQVHKSVVVAQEEGAQKRLVGYVVPVRGNANQAAPLSVGALREHLRSRLPEYMIPAAFVLLDELPMTANGKVDRRGLPTPTGRPELVRPYAPPRDPMEQQLCAIWEKLLAVDRVGIDDNFFELGGNSLLAAQAIARVADAFGAQLPVRWLFEEGTVGALSRVLKEIPRAASPEVSARVKARIDQMDPDQIRTLLEQKRAERAARLTGYDGGETE